MIFGEIKTEAKVQVNDKTRIDASDTFKDPDEADITKVEIQPEGTASFFDVTGTNPEDWFLDWKYSSDGEKTITLRVTTDSTPETFTDTIEVITEADDKLFSNDKDLLSHEDDILRHTPVGKNSFLNKHREAQTLIIGELARRGVTQNDGSKLTKNDLFDIDEVREWSKYLTLSIIFRELATERDDFYMQKSDFYRQLAEEESSRAGIRLDTDQDGSEDENRSLFTGAMVRR